MLELSDQQFKTIMINMQRTLVGKIDNMQEQIDNISWEKEILRKTKKNC